MDPNNQSFDMYNVLHTQSGGPTLSHIWILRFATLLFWTFRPQCAIRDRQYPSKFLLHNGILARIIHARQTVFW